MATKWHAVVSVSSPYDTHAAFLQQPQQCNQRRAIDGVCSEINKKLAFAIGTFAAISSAHAVCGLPGSCIVCWCTVTETWLTQLRLEDATSIHSTTDIENQTERRNCDVRHVHSRWWLLHGWRHYVKTDHFESRRLLRKSLTTASFNVNWLPCQCYRFWRLRFVNLTIISESDVCSAASELILLPGRSLIECGATVTLNSNDAGDFFLSGRDMLEKESIRVSPWQRKTTDRSSCLMIHIYTASCFAESTMLYSNVTFFPRSYDNTLFPRGYVQLWNFFHIKFRDLFSVCGIRPSDAK